MAIEEGCWNKPRGLLLPKAPGLQPIRRWTDELVHRLLLPKAPGLQPRGFYPRGLANWQPLTERPQAPGLQPRGFHPPAIAN